MVGLLSFHGYLIKCHKNISHTWLSYMLPPPDWHPQHGNVQPVNNHHHNIYSSCINTFQPTFEDTHG